METITKICLAIALLNMSLVSIAAEERFYKPMQEPINQWEVREDYQRAGRAFLAGLHHRLGAGSVLNQLPSYVARDIVEFAKPQDYGYIKNFTDKSIVFLAFDIVKENTGRIPCVFFPKIFSRANCLASHHQISFFMFDKTEHDRSCLSNYYYSDSLGRQNYWIPDLNTMLFGVSVELQGEPRMDIENVFFSLCMNFKIYKESGRIRLEITSPGLEPVSYYSE